MKRIVMTVLLALSIVAGFACTGKGDLSKRQAKKVKEYFANTLKGVECEYSNGKCGTAGVRRSTDTARRN